MHRGERENRMYWATSVPKVPAPAAVSTMSSVWRKVSFNGGLPDCLARCRQSGLQSGRQHVGLSGQSDR